MSDVPTAPTQQTKAAEFLALHVPGSPLLFPNPWDLGSARLLAGLGFQALATTSSGFAGTFGRLDGGVTRDEVLAHTTALCDGVDVPVAADLEDAFAPDPDGVAETIRLAKATGLAGGSVEDFTRDEDDPIHPLEAAAERVAAAAAAAHEGDVHFVLTARAENHLHGRRDLDDTIARLQAYQEAGADVLFAPGVTDPDELRRLVAEVDRPVNVLIFPGQTVDELAAAGVARISVGGAFFWAAMGAVVDAATELREQGTTGFWAAARTGVNAAKPVFTAR